MTLRDATPVDFGRIVALNASEVQHTSAMDAARLAALHAMAAYHRVIESDGTVVAFLLAFREGAEYDSENYRWFAPRYPRFLYVDRIVVDAAAAGQRLGSRLYEDLFDVARAQGVEIIACEYNLQPPNPASRAFHDRFGFREVGTQWLDRSAKQVSLQVATTVVSR